MRWLTVAAFVVILSASGCSRVIDGAAVGPATNPTQTVLLTGDGFGIQLGKPTARVALEMFMDPQCALCARLQMFQGGEIADDIDSGDLAMTYRLVTPPGTGPAGYAHRVANALFVAADAGLTAVELQAYVQQLYWDADPSRDDGYLADVAASARLPQAVIDRIRAGGTVVDTVAMDAANRKLLNGIGGDNAVPKVYDLNTHQIVDTVGNDWLQRLVGHR